MWKKPEREIHPLTSKPFKRKQNKQAKKQTCFTGAIVSLVSCLRKCFPLKGLKQLGVCLVEEIHFWTGNFFYTSCSELRMPDW